MSIQLTPGSHELFAALIEDAGNWHGQPLIGGNVEMTKARKGNLSDLVKKGLLEVVDDGEGHTYAKFTSAGVDYAKEHGLPDADWLAVELGFTTEEAVETVAAIYENGLEMNPAEGEAFEAPLEVEEETDEEEEEEEMGSVTFIPGVDPQALAALLDGGPVVSPGLQAEMAAALAPEAAPAEEAPRPAKPKATPRAKLVLTDLEGNEVESRRAPTPDTLTLVVTLVETFGGQTFTDEQAAEVGFDVDTLKRVLKRVKSWFGKDKVAHGKDGWTLALKVREEGSEASEATETAEVA